MKARTLLVFVLTLACACDSLNNAPYHGGAVVDAATGMAVKDAFVTLGNSVAQTDQNGRFRIYGTGEVLRVRAWGYGRVEVAAQGESGPGTIALKPFQPKALYLSFYGIGDRKLRESALGVIRDTELNALVIDLKGDRGMVAFKSANPIVAEVGAQKVITIPDIRALVADMHARGIYLIARIVVFKDNKLAVAKPFLAIRTKGGAIWRDREGLAWTEPFNKSAWAYNIDVAVEAARAGFDEIQFDYLRFPDAEGLAYTMPNTRRNRVAAITGFLAQAKVRLLPYNVFLATDFFGYVPWNEDDTHIGQEMEYLAAVLDYMSPMLYPSTFQFGIPGYPNPVLHPGEVVQRSLETAKKRTGLPGIRFRPWLQAFRDYAFGGRAFQGREIRLQIDAAEISGSDGWMLWNARNIYSEQGLKPKR